MPGPENDVPAHVHLTESENLSEAECITAGIVCFTEDNRLIYVDNKSGDFRPSFNSLQFVLPHVVGLSIPIADSISIYGLNDRGGFQEKHSIESSTLVSLLSKKEIISTNDNSFFTNTSKKHSLNQRLPPDPKTNRRLGFDYFENSRRAVIAQWLYARRNEKGMRDYGSLDWGLTASDGPANVIKKYKGKTISFLTYSERGAPDGFDDGTLAPTAAISSIVYAPTLVIKTMRHWLTTRSELFNHHGFADAFNPTFNIHSNSCWVDTDRLAIDQGPILMMIENYRTGLIWRVMNRDPHIKQGLRRAGFE